jgi:serine/threonine-protein kinase
MRQEQFGPYRVVKLIGRGGMGSVYEAVDPGSGQEVALKTLASHLADDAGLRRRFFAEIETLKGLVNPGIVRLLAFGEQEGMPYFAMELVRGKSVEDVLRREGPLDWRRALRIATSISRSLKVAHDHGVVHRDLKPANILLGDDGLTKLADFGIAKLFGNSSLTAHGSVVGTAQYMAPEQAAGRPTDHRVDFYALGASMFAMLAGHPPFRGSSMIEVIEQHQTAPAPRVATVAKDVPPALDELIDRLLAKDPAGRPATALVLTRLLEAIDAVSAVGDVDPAAEKGERGGTVAVGSKGSAGDPTDRTAPEQGRPDVDLLAATIGTATSPAARGAATDVPSPTEVATTRVEPARQNRFTTVENLARLEEERRRRIGRSQTIVRSLATLGMVAAAAAAAYALLRPPTADESYVRIMKVVDGGGDLRDAETSIRRFLARHGEDPRADRIKGLAARLEIDDLERDLRRPQRRSGEKLDSPQRDYLAAMERAEESPSAGIAALRAWLVLHSDGDTLQGANGDIWQALVERQIERLSEAAEAERADDAKRLAAALDEARLLADEAAREADPLRAEELLTRRAAILEAVVQLFVGRPHARNAVREAARLLDQDAPAETPPRETR